MSNVDSRFVDTCVELNLLTVANAQLLASSAIEANVSVAQLSVRRGLLTPADVDVVESLLHPDETVPGYKIESIVGRGAMGVVYKARQIDLDRTVALKTILLSSVKNSLATSRFEREAKALARLQHPNIVQALNFGSHHGRFYFAMEFAQGRNCEQALQQQGRLAPQIVWPIVRQVASGLLHAFNHDLIHRDIKPANLILMPPPEGSTLPSGVELVKIADFGLALLADRSLDDLHLTSGSQAIGSPLYMSPEQFGDHPVDFRTDIYALGVTAWHLLCGVPPFRGNNLATLLRQKSNPLTVDWSTVPVKLPDNQGQLLQRMMDPNRQRRPSSYHELIAAIDDLALGDGSMPNPSRPAPSIHSVPSSAADAVDTIAFAQTIETPSVTAARRRWIKWLGLPIAVTVLIAASFGFYAVRQPQIGPRSYTRVTTSEALYDGLTLSGWDVGGSMLGAWNTAEAPDGSTAIACMTAQGALTRRLPDSEHYRISLFVWLGATADAVEIDFALDTAKPKSKRGCLRLSDTKLQLGIKTDETAELQVVAETTAVATIHDRYHVVRMERQSEDWFVFFENERIGTLPTSRLHTGNAIRLVVSQASPESDSQPTVFFSDVQLDELQLPVAK